MAFFNARFEDFRLILSIQGYQLNNQFIVREVGYWSPNLSGIIQFNCKISASRLDTLVLKTYTSPKTNVMGLKSRKLWKMEWPRQTFHQLLNVCIK